MRSNNILPLIRIYSRALAECIRLYELMGTEIAARQAERFFDACYRLLSSNSEVAKESTLITVGAIAK